MPVIEAVLFDYGLVLSGPQDPTAWAAMQQSLEAPEAAFSAAYWQYRHDYDRGTLNGESYWQAVAAALGTKLTAAQLTALLNEDVRLWTRPNAPMIDWAARLQQAGIRTGILSNIGDAMEAGILTAASWLNGFAHHTFSHRLKLAKPELAIYRHAADGLGVTPEHILFIDDREENIVGAEAAGMQAILYGTHEQFIAAMRQRGLADLLDV